jgi:hypothetical protein
MTEHLPELVNDPHWSGRVMHLGKARLLVLTIDHPRHGEIHCLLEPTSAARLWTWLEDALRVIEE